MFTFFIYTYLHHHNILLVYSKSFCHQFTVAYDLIWYKIHSCATISPTILWPLTFFQLPRYEKMSIHADNSTESRPPLPSSQHCRLLIRADIKNDKKIRNARNLNKRSVLLPPSLDCERAAVPTFPFAQMPLRTLCCFINIPHAAVPRDVDACVSGLPLHPETAPPPLRRLPSPKRIMK